MKIKKGDRVFHIIPEVNARKENGYPTYSVACHEQTEPWQGPHHKVSLEFIAKVEKESYKEAKREIMKRIDELCRNSAKKKS